MAHIEKSIDVNVPVRTAYNQWTQFESFPGFMDNLNEVRQLGDKQLLWRATVAGKEVQWETTITEQIPDRRIAWQSTSGPDNAGAVEFQSISGDATRVTLHMDYNPDGALETLGDVLGFTGRTTEENLQSFKTFIEGRGHETGAWRGRIGPEDAERDMDRTATDIDASTNSNADTGMGGRPGAAPYSAGASRDAGPATGMDPSRPGGSPTLQDSQGLSGRHGTTPQDQYGYGGSSPLGSTPAGGTDPDRNGGKGY